MERGGGRLVDRPVAYALSMAQHSKLDLMGTRKVVEGVRERLPDDDRRLREVTVSLSETLAAMALPEPAPWYRTTKIAAVILIVAMMLGLVVFHLLVLIEAADAWRWAELFEDPIPAELTRLAVALAFLRNAAVVVLVSVLLLQIPRLIQRLADVELVTSLRPMAYAVDTVLAEEVVEKDSPDGGRSRQLERLGMGVELLRCVARGAAGFERRAIGRQVLDRIEGVEGLSHSLALIHQQRMGLLAQGGARGD